RLYHIIVILFTLCSPFFFYSFHYTSPTIISTLSLHDALPIYRDSLHHLNAEKVPPRERVFGEGHYLRPNFVQFYKSKNILISGVTLVRSPMWNIHPVLSENVTIKDVRIETLGPNNDGVNPESSKNVLITDSYFDTGDDCIAIKSGRNQDGRR